MERSLRTLAAAGVLVLGLAPVVSAQTLPPPLQPFPVSGFQDGPAATGDGLVEITRQVPPGEVATALTVPADARLTVTDVLLTNLGTVPVCGVSIERGTGPTVLTGPVLGATEPSTITVTDSTLTGPLCVQPRSTQQLILTAGVDFTAGQAVQVANRTDTVPTPGVEAPGPVSFHLRGFLTAAPGTTPPGTIVPDATMPGTTPMQ
jgi:hypothetical protein